MQGALLSPLCSPAPRLRMCAAHLALLTAIKDVCAILSRIASSIDDQLPLVSVH